ncbi:hypothetical protein Tco_1468993 [Tanacetum coccineum]
MLHCLQSLLFMAVHKVFALLCGLMKTKDVYQGIAEKAYCLGAFSLFLLALAASEVFGADEDAGSVVACPYSLLDHRDFRLVTAEVGG